MMRDISGSCKGNNEFNGWSKRISVAQREPDQPVVKIEIDDLAPPIESRLINPRLLAA